MAGATYQPRQDSFAGGELSPAFWGRTRWPKYGEGLRQLRNFIVTAEANATRRQGATHQGYINTGAGAGSDVRLVPFLTSDDSGVVVAIDTYKIRFWDGGDLVTASDADVFAGTALEGECFTYNDGGGNRVYRALVDTTDNPTVAPDDWHLLPRNAGEPEDVVEITNPFIAYWLPSKLKWAQAGATLTLCLQQYPAPGYVPRELKRFSSTRWTVGSYTTLPDQWGATVPAGLVLTSSTAADATHPVVPWEIVVTAISDDPDFPQESMPSATLTPGGGLAVYIDRTAKYSWTATTGAGLYGVYRGQGGKWGLLGYTETNSFVDRGDTPDYSILPPTGRNPFDSGGTEDERNPGVVAYMDQREWFAASGLLPSTVWATRLGQLHSFDKGLIVRADDSIQATLSSTRYEEIRSMLPKRKGMLLFGAGGVATLRGIGGAPPNPADGVDMNTLVPVPASALDPLDVGANEVLYVTAGGHLQEVMIDFDNEQAKTRDLSLLALHLWRNHSISDCVLSRSPHPTAWLRRDDGLLLSCSYVPDTGQVAWALHSIRPDDATDSGTPFPGVVQRLCVIPEDGEDILYIAAQVYDSDPVGIFGGDGYHWVMLRIAALTPDATSAEQHLRVFSDSSISYDGYVNDGSPNDETLITGTKKIKLTGVNGTNGVVNVQAQNFTFSAHNVGDKLQFQTGGQVVTLTAYVNATNMSGTLSAAVSAPNFGAFVTDIHWARKELYAPHLPLTGNCALIDDVAYDGIDGPDTDGYVVLPVAGYFTTLGVPFASRLEFLDAVQQRGHEKNVAELLLEVRDTMAGFQVGPDFDNLQDVAVDEYAETDSETGLLVDTVRAPVDGTWGKHGRACIQITDAIPFTLVAAIRELEVSE